MAGKGEQCWRTGLRALRPLCGGRKVILDPSPEMVNERTVGLVSLLRESFLDLIMDRRGRPLRLGEPEERGSPQIAASG